MTNAKPSTVGTRTLSGIFVRPINKATTTVPTTTPSEARPNSGLRVIDGRASHNAPITIPTFRHAPRHMSLLPSRPNAQSSPATTSSPSPIAPTNERFTVTGCEFMGGIMQGVVDGG